MPAGTPHARNVGSAPASIALEETWQPPITPELFRKFQQLIHQESGIWLGDAKTALLCGRLSRRLRARAVPTFDRYYKLVLEPDQREERVAMIDAITTNETRFFREPKQFEYLERRVIPRWKAEAEHGLRSKTVRLWSAGCSSGEEPYSLAMLAGTHLTADRGWKVTILATDISTRMLDRARAGIYRMEKSADIAPSFLKSCMLKGIDDQEGNMKVMPEIRQMVEFQRLNLMHDPYPEGIRFDAIFCRNVLIYFDPVSKGKIVERLTDSLQHGGLLFFGQAETLSGMNSKLRTLGPSVCTRSGDQSAL
ncbi:MAG TPA: protein-glutamate O-methyltransferase [Candidatus Binatia bacterium]|nr:protein-glutamate O-methyltransferase [Candidatus Binatia bacterium]